MELNRVAPSTKSLPTIAKPTCISSELAGLQGDELREK
jgi:hypothetical protein